MAVQISGNDITVPRDGSFTRNVTIGGTLTYEDVTNIDSVGLVTARTGIEIGARPGVAASISIDGNMIVSGISTFGGDVQVPDKIIHSGDTNTAIRFPSADTITAETAGTERVRIASDGKIGINTATPDCTLHVVKNVAGTMSADGNAVLALENSDHCVLNMMSPADKSSYIMMGDPDDQNAGQIRYDNNINALLIDVNGSEKLRITSGGNILKGHDTASTNFHDPQTTTDRTPTIQIHGGNSVGASAALVSWNSNTGSYYSNALYLAHSGSSTIGTNGIVSGSNTLGSIVFSGDDGDEFIKGAMISAHVDGTPGADDMPARLQFWTNAGSDALTERARINTQGHFFVDCTSEPTQGDSGARITNGSYHTFARATNSSSVLRSFGNNGEFRTLGTGNVQNTNNSYGSISDVELKENIVDANSQLNDIKALKIRSYNFKESTGYNTHKQIGVVAQELEASGLNGLVETNPDELYIAGDEIPDGKNIGDVKEKGYKTVKYSVLYMKAIKALQEAIAKIETLEAKVSALEG